jgi:hypothetical protein
MSAGIVHLPVYRNRKIRQRVVDLADQQRLAVT